VPKTIRPAAAPAWRLPEAELNRAAAGRVDGGSGLAPGDRKRLRRTPRLKPCSATCGRGLPPGPRPSVQQLLNRGLRVGVVPTVLVTRALARAWRASKGRDRPSGLMGAWSPSSDAFRALSRPADGTGRAACRRVASNPVFLASPRRSGPSWRVGYPAHGRRMGSGTASSAALNPPAGTSFSLEPVVKEHW